MTKNEFLHKFQLNSLSASTQNFRYNHKFKHAAVLIPVIEVDLPDNGKQLNIILTKRASHLKHHPGQISFPGGKVEMTDKTIIETALRETHEEIGIPPKIIDVIGQLHPYHTITGYIITPIIGLVTANDPMVIDKNEVEEVFQVPLLHFLNQENHHTVNVMQQKIQHKVHFMPYGNYNIWGATAAILKDFAAHLE